jgi:hypothetical protein
MTQAVGVKFTDCLFIWKESLVSSSQRTAGDPPQDFSASAGIDLRDITPDCTLAVLLTPLLKLISPDINLSYESIYCLASDNPLCN